MKRFIRYLCFYCASRAIYEAARGQRTNTKTEHNHGMGTIIVALIVFVVIVWLLGYYVH